MSLPLCHKMGERNFWLSPGRTLFWDEERMLIVSDLHFGKTGHFRKAGIAIPQNLYKDDLHRLLTEIRYFNPEKVVVVGDFFHSSSNKEHDLFGRWRESVDADFILVKGNHDILNNNWYNSIGIEVIEDCWYYKNVMFTHDRDCTVDQQEGVDFMFSGHLHPGVEIRGPGKQFLRFPCFYFAGNYAILPAFSVFTGIFPLPANKAAAVYLLLPADATNPQPSIFKL